MADEKPPHPRTVMNRKSRERQKMDEATVISIFGAPPTDEPPLDPDGIRPRNDYTDVKEDLKAGKKPTRKSRGVLRVGRRFTELMQRVEAGEITMREFVKTLSPEELVRGQMKAEDGTWRGAPPKWIPAEFHNECTRELLKRGDILWREAYLDAIKVFMDIARNELLEPQHRLKAAQYVVERIAGKTPEKIEVAVAQPWETLISGIVAEAEDDAIARATRVLGGGES